MPIKLAGTSSGNVVIQAPSIAGTNTLTVPAATDTLVARATVDTLSNKTFTNVLETCTVSATAATGTINYDLNVQAVLYYTTSASGNWTINFRNSSTSTLNSLMAIGQVITASFLATQGTTPYYNTVVQVDGSTVTPKWQGGFAPTFGNPSGIDLYTYTIIKTASATFTVLASQTKFT